MAGRERMSTWIERENNKRRERRRRAISTKIYSGLRLHGNYNLPKHCDNNEVLKALCQQAGWIVHHDGTTYRKGCKPPSDNMDIIGPSVSVSPSSYDPSPSSSSFPSPAHYMGTANSITDPNSLIPWLKNLSSNSCSASPKHPHFYIPGGSVSAPVTPPMSPPTNSQSGPNSPTFSFVSRNPFECGVKGGSRMWTPGQSGTCSPAVATGFYHMENVPMADGIAAEFAFGDRSSMGVVKAWEGERIHEECIPDDLDLKL